MVDNVLFHVTYGSYAHGTADENSDRDDRVIFFNKNPIEIKNYFIENQTVYMDFSFFMRNCIRCIPFELEALYADKNLFKIDMPIELRNLIESYPFVSKYMFNQYITYAEMKFRQSRQGEIAKPAYQSMRMLIEAKNLILNKKGPMVNVGDNKDYLIKIKNGNYNIVDDYFAILNEVQLLKQDLPRQPDVGAIVRTQELIMQKYRK